MLTVIFSILNKNKIVIDCEIIDGVQDVRINV